MLIDGMLVDGTPIDGTPIDGALLKRFLVYDLLADSAFNGTPANGLSPHKRQHEMFFHVHNEN